MGISVEYICKQNENLRISLFDYDNNIVAVVMEGTKNTKWNLIASDYRSGMNCIYYEGKLYVEYISIENEVILRRIGEDRRVILMKLGDSISEIIGLALGVLNNNLYMLYVKKTKDTECELFSMDIVDKKEIKKITTIYSGCTSVCFEAKKDEILMFFDNFSQKYMRIFIVKDKQLQFESLYICNENVIFELEEKCKIIGEEYNKSIKKQSDEIVNRYEKRIKTMEKQYKEQYLELEKLAKDIQEEGRKWRDKYYKSIKKNEGKT